ncbi:uncharacterized protein LOC124406240 [Diprion similis]|uniref:uncharacterized protein LOC124406240 n=1 Tax=Diprion similis TaxID=362088 RepID=UPI001EF8640D|nr:uncharacterized protein LOC124406240 [Diprion similis]
MSFTEVFTFYILNVKSSINQSECLDDEKCEKLRNHLRNSLYLMMEGDCREDVNKETDTDHNRIIPLILDGKFFKIVARDKENVQAECTKCKREIKGQVNATTNFLNHLKIDGNEQQASTSKKQAQSTLKHAFSRSGQQSADALITSFVVETMSPLCIVEHPAFKKLIHGINNLQIPIGILTRKTLRTKIDAMYSQMLTYLLQQLQPTEHVCTTADIWSSSKRSFLGVTVNWINKDLQRESAALACRRFKGGHTYEKIAELIHEIHSEFKLSSTKVLKTTTDNASNMVKAFITFSQPQGSIDATDLDDDDVDDDDEVTVTGILDNESTSDALLPEHQRCASHTLNLVASVDIKAALKEPPVNSGVSYNRSHHSAFGKCSAIWNLTSRSPKAAETYVGITGEASSFPCPTRWNSTYDCLLDLLKVKQALSDVCCALELPKFKETDLEFLEEYIKCVRPIAEALDRLQGDKNCYYGELLPISVQMRKTLQKLRLRHLKYCPQLVTVLLGGLEKRFCEYYTFSPQTNDAILASISHPFFKLRWVAKERRNHVKELLFNGTSSDESIINVSTKNSVQLQCLQYLQTNDNTLESLNQFPVIKKLFLKYNTPLPSSALVERLFSYGSMIMRPRRRSMNDDTFEKQLLLKANTAFINILRSSDHIST